MEDKFFQVYNVPSEGTVAKTFMANVFMWMGGALATSAAVAWFFSQSEMFLSLMVGETGLSYFGYGIMFAPLIFVLALSFGWQKLSLSAIMALFIGYSVINGMSLSFIFLIYKLGSIAGIFMASSAMFGLMAIVGYTTKTDLTSFGSIMIMGLFGIVIASVVNMFMKSDAMSYVISVIAVLVFTGLTAYDVQKLKYIGMTSGNDGMTMRKVAIMGALELYLDFINLFLALLRLFGGRKD
jgi:FtsH-binding integral membrane protein